MRMGLRLIAFWTFLAAVTGVMASYQIFSVSDAIAFSGANELTLLVVWGFRCVQFFGSVLTMQWVYDDNEATR